MIKPTHMPAGVARKPREDGSLADSTIPDRALGPGHRRPGGMPGTSWVLAAIYLWHVVIARGILYNFGVAIPFQLVSAVGNVCVLGLLTVGVYTYTRHNPLLRNFPAWCCQGIYIWFILLALCLPYGMIHGNEVDMTIKEFMAGCYIGFFLILGRDDRFWYGIEKPLTVLFYISASLVIAFSFTPMVQVVGGDVVQDYSAPISTGARLIFTLGHSLRPLMDSGLLLGAWGLVRKHEPVWNVLQVSALFVMFACDVGLFLYRGAVVTIALVVLGYIVLRPLLLGGKVISTKSVLLLASAAIVFMGYLKMNQSVNVLDRFNTETEGAGILESRNQELRSYLDDMGVETLIGRGMGGTFDGTDGGKVDSIDPTADYTKWGYLHYGILIFTLKGGIVMLVIFTSWLIQGLRHRQRSWYKNPCNLTAALLFPVYVLQSFTSPFPFSIEGLLFFLALMVPLSRFCMRLPSYSITWQGVPPNPYKPLARVGLKGL